MLLERLLERRAHPSNPDRFLVRVFGGRDSAAGVQVDEEKSLSITAFYQAVRLYGETMGSLPLKIMREDTDMKRVARDHPSFEPLHVAPNEEQTSMELREMLQGHAMVWGTGFAHTIRDGGGHVREIWPLVPWRVRTERLKNRDRTLIYKVRLPGTNQETTLFEDQVFRLRGFSVTGIRGMNLAEIGKEALGLTLAMEQFGASWFGNGSWPGGFIKHPGGLSDKAKENIHKGIEKVHGGIKKSHRIGILEEGMDWIQAVANPEQSQMRDARVFQIDEMARLTNTPPHMLKQLDRATFSNIEEMGLEWVIYSIAPWAVRWEQAINLRILTPGDRAAGYYAKHSLEGLLRGDSKSRGEFYQRLIQTAVMTPNEARHHEDLDPHPGGDQLFVPLNLIPLDQAAIAVEDTPEGRAVAKRIRETRARRSARGRRRLIGAFGPTLRAAAVRAAKREARDIRRAAKDHLSQRDVGTFLIWFDAYLQDELPGIVDANMRGVFQVYAEAVREAMEDELEDMPTAEVDLLVDGYTKAFTDRWIGRLRDQLPNLDSIELEDLEEALDDRVEKEPDYVQMKDSNQLNNAVAKMMIVAAGMKSMWASIGESSCPYCEGLDGTIVSGNENFLDKGSSYQPDGADEPLIVGVAVGHPPGHDGCDCMLVPV